MDTIIAKTARVFGVPEEVVDVIGRDFIWNLTEELPILFLPAFMSELKRLLDTHGQDWITRNVIHLKVYFTQLRHMDEPREAEPGRIEALIEAVAAQYRVSVDVLNLVGVASVREELLLLKRLSHVDPSMTVIPSMVSGGTLMHRQKRTMSVLHNLCIPVNDGRRQDTRSPPRILWP